MKGLTKDQQIDITLLFATFRCFNEQLYNLKGTHSNIIKKKFNHLLKVSSQYEKEIVVSMDSKELENCYDVLMDIILTVKKELENYEEKVA